VLVQWLTRRFGERLLQVQLSKRGSPCGVALKAHNHVSGAGESAGAPAAQKREVLASQVWLLMLALDAVLLSAHQRVAALQTSSLSLTESSLVLKCLLHDLSANFDIRLDEGGIAASAASDQPCGQDDAWVRVGNCRCLLSVAKGFLATLIRRVNKPALWRLQANDRAQKTVLSPPCSSTGVQGCLFVVGDPKYSDPGSCHQYDTLQAAAAPTRQAL
jgi:hypothetical protein